MKLDYSEFVNEVVAELSRRMQGRCHVCSQTYRKNNGIVRLAVCISDGVHKVCPCYYMESYYKIYQEADDIKLIADDIVKTFQKEDMDNYSADWLMEHDKILEHVLFLIVSTEKNSRQLEDIPHYDVPGLGLSMLFYMIADMGGEYSATMLIMKHHLKMCSISEIELMECAWKNTPVAMEYVITGIGELLAGASAAADSKAWQLSEMPPMYIVTNRQKLYGAGCILYPGLLEKIAEKSGSDLYILPSSVHETIIIPAGGFDRNQAETLKMMVEEINRTELSGEDVLADSVFCYCRKEHRLFLAA